MKRMADATLRFDQYKAANDIQYFVEYYANSDLHAETNEAVSGLVRARQREVTDGASKIIFGTLQSQVLPSGGPTQPAIAAAPQQLALPAPEKAKRRARGKGKGKKCTICHQRVQHAQTAVCLCVVVPTLLLTLMRTHQYYLHSLL